MRITQKTVLTTSLTILAASILAACGSGDDDGPAATTFSGKVVAAAAQSSTSGNPTLTPGYYAGATVFIDINGNGVLDAGEPSTTTDASGSFTLAANSGVSGQFVADVPKTATNTATKATVPGHLILRASAAQVAEQGSSAIVISPLSSEVQRLVEAKLPPTPPKRPTSRRA
jgi:hypothetical protein